MQEWNDVHTNEVAFTKYTHFVGTGIASGPLSFPPASVTGSGRVTCMSHKPRKRPPHALYPWSPCHYVASKVQRREHWIHHSLLPVNSMKNTFSTYSESESCSVVSDSLRPHGLNSPWNSPGQNTGVGNLSLLQEVFPTQGLNPGLPHCRRILYQLSHQGSLRIVEWVAYPFFSRSSRPRNRTGSPALQADFFIELWGKLYSAVSNFFFSV